MRRASMRVEHHEISAPAPSEFFARNQILDLVRIFGGDPKTFDWDIGKSALSVVRIDGDHDQNNVVESLRRFGVEQYLFVLDRMKSEVLVLTQGAILLANRVELSDVLLDVAGRVPIPLFQLVFFRIKILFFTRDPDIFT